MFIARLFRCLFRRHTPPQPNRPVDFSDFKPTEIEVNGFKPSA